MAEFTEVMKQRERMCNSFNTSCTNCPLEKVSDGWCGGYTIDHPQEAEEIIMKWAEENPVQTNADKFKEVFGIENTYSCHFVTSEECEKHRTCYTCPYNNFMKKEYKAPKGE